MPRTAPSPRARDALAALLDANNRHDPETAARLYAETGTHEDVAQGRPAHGPAAIADGLRRFLTSFPDARWSVQRLVGDDVTASAEYVLTATLREDLGPFRAAGQRLELCGAMVIVAGEDGIRESRDYWDSGTLARQLNEDQAPA
jgi:steroid delta-isomerase-like uncharacterized protein